MGPGQQVGEDGRALFSNRRHVPRLLRIGTWRRAKGLVWPGAAPKSCHWNALAFLEQQDQQEPGRWFLFAGYGTWQMQLALEHACVYDVYNLVPSDNSENLFEWVFGVAVSYEDARDLVQSGTDPRVGYDVLSCWT